MQSMYSPATQQQLTERINKLKPDTQRLWGTMDVAQMMAHCVVGVEMALSDIPLKRNFISYLFGKMAKKSIWSEKPFRRNLPTAPTFVIVGERQFEQEKQNLTQAIAKLSKEPESALAKRTHPFFGQMSGKDWDMLMYRHLDHHLSQFGV